MESFRFMAGMGVDAAMEHIQKTQSRAKEQMERMSSDMSTGVSRIRASATEIASIDLSKLELAGSIDRLKESACSGALPAFATCIEQHVCTAAIA
eukprot:2843543-Pleurochrysis_carterae.AAC.2